MSAPPAVRAFEYYAYQYRRVWRGSVFSSIVIPLVFLGAMGLGVGSLIRGRDADALLGGVPYLDFLAPGLLAASVVTIVVGECTWPILGQLKWEKTYHAMLSTPLRATDALHGNLAWVGVRILITTVAYFLAMILFGTLHSWWAGLAIPASLLTGLALATPLMAFAAGREDPGAFSLIFRFGEAPMFLFSGTFFPISQLPAPLQPVAWVSPLWHGIELCRSFTLDTFTPTAAQLVLLVVHLLYLALWFTVGLLLARRVFTRRLVV